ncbi:MAG TPA: NUDIX hydrolase [Gammaproteobacteria bacterium]|nr:NUDIX hydrolase [Gammaproteobacteria bacterium]
MKYCSLCGAEVSHQVPPDDNRPRYVCLSCRTVHYQNPRIVAGCLPEYEGKVLLCKRAIDPRYGYWTLPAGFMELGETSLEGAIRETREEANANVEVLELYMVLNLPHVDQVYMMFRSRLKDLDFSPGEESLEVDLFSEDEIPWDELAFSTIRETLRCFFRDRETGLFRLHTGDIVKTGEGYDFRAAPRDGKSN